MPRSPNTQMLELKIDAFLMLCSKPDEWKVSRHVIDYSESTIELAMMGPDHISRTLKLKFNVSPDTTSPLPIVKVSGLVCKLGRDGHPSWIIIFRDEAAIPPTVEAVETATNERYLQLVGVSNEVVALA